jgi:ABC-2 type transport system ATP-binding protein
LLDEPVAHLDPIVREQFLAFLFELMQEDQATIVISSHVLYDIESIADWVVCLNRGQVVADAALDDLKEQFVEWRVAPRSGRLPSRFEEPFIVHETLLTPGAARVVVRRSDADLASFQGAHDVDVAVQALNLQGLFPALVEAGRQ